MNHFFKNLKVVELANVLAGPAVGMFFSELGADVIKIENKLTGGDVTRSWKLPSEDVSSPVSAYYASVNWNKTSLFIDFNIKKERERVLEIIREADVVIVNYKPGDDKKWGMNYAALKKINPTIIYGQITGFGEKDKRTAFDLVLQAETGFMYMNGTPQSGPLKMPVAIIDLMAAHQLKEGILLAMMRKMKTGKGGKVSVSLFDAAVASLANQAANWLVANHNPQPIGSLHPNIAPYGEIFETIDHRKIVLAIGTDKQFKLLCEFFKSPKLSNKKAFYTNSSRVVHREKLAEILRLEFKKYSAVKIMKYCYEHDIPAGVVKSVAEVFENKETKSNLLTTVNAKKKKISVVKTVALKM